VSTSNNVPTREDLHAVLLRGMPGSSMPPWKHLSQVEREALVDEVMRLRTEGARQIYVAQLKEFEELSDEEIAAESVQQDIRKFVTEFTTPGATTAIPDVTDPTSERLAAAKGSYTKLCLSCHGAEGKGDGVQKMTDLEGYPTRPRDFTAGIFKGGDDFASLYRRIAYGMPGTPMPSSSQQLTPEQMSDLVHFIRAMSTEEQRAATVLKREQITAARVAAVPTDASDLAVWANVPGISIRTTPLWWRDNAEVGLTVQALHDGKSLAMRMSWKDTTENASAVGPDEFEDMGAMELCTAGNEPFLGMGAVDTLVDIWQWRAGWASFGAENHLSDEYPFDTDEYRRLAQGTPLPDFVSARVAGNPLAIRDHTGSNLAAKGPGSLTFRPPISQQVAASGAWNDGRWSVLLVRPLSVASADDGVSLAPGASYAAAFAIWDGAARDRAAQKLISIWNDLKLE
jgi:mono/diheme cytochrome c family protein